MSDLIFPQAVFFSQPLVLVHITYYNYYLLLAREAAWPSGERVEWSTTNPKFPNSSPALTTTVNAPTVIIHNH